MTTQTAIKVHITPPAPDLLAGATVIVLDILRATTVHDALIAGGAQRIYPVADFAAGIALRTKLGDAKLIGEINALPPPQADYGNSATEFAALDVRDWKVVHVTSNGTRALLGAAQAAQALSACLRNRAAAVERTLAQATDRIAIVCSGDHGGSAPSVEDAFAAGAYVDAIHQAAPHLALQGGARLALKLYDAYDRNPATAFADSPHARRLQDLGFHQDLKYAAEIDVSTTIAVLSQDQAGCPYLHSD